MNNSTTPAAKGVFFSFLGSRDPFHAPDSASTGPLLDLWQVLAADPNNAMSEAVVAYTPDAPNRVQGQEMWEGGYNAQAQALQQWFAEHAPNVRLRLERLKCGKPNDARELLPDIERILGTLRRREDVFLHINASSGTPQMGELLKTLRGTGWFIHPAKVYQVDAPQHRRAGEPHVREAVTPYLAEALQLEAAFEALRRFDFAGAYDEFDRLAEFPMEVSGRQESVATLAEICDALLLLDERDYAEAEEVLGALPLHIPELDSLKELVSAAEQYGSDALVWLTWGRYDRARQQVRQADALIWAVILQELMVTQLCVQHGLTANSKGRISRAELGSKFRALKSEVPSRFQGDTLKIMNTSDILEVLSAPSILGAEAIKPFNTEHNADLDKVRTLRNRVVHQGVQTSAAEVNWDLLDSVVQGLLEAFPFQDAAARAWVKNPDTCPVSAAALQQLAADLKDWLN